MNQKLRDAIEAGVGVGLEEWLADGRGNLAAALDTIEFRQKIVAKVTENHAYIMAGDALVKADRDVDALRFFAELAKEFLPVLLAAV